MKSDDNLMVHKNILVLLRLSISKKKKCQYSSCTYTYNTYIVFPLKCLFLFRNINYCYPQILKVKKNLDNNKNSILILNL